MVVKLCNLLIDHPQECFFKKSNVDSTLDLSMAAEVAQALKLIKVSTMSTVSLSKLESLSATYKVNLT